MTTIDYRHELQLRDDALRRELDLRHEAFKGEQALRDKAWDERFNGFLSAQVERDKAFESICSARFDRIEKDIASIKTDARAVASDVHGLRLTLAKYFGGAIVIGAISSAALSAGLRLLLS